MAQLVARMHGVHEAVGSSPATPTTGNLPICHKKYMENTNQSDLSVRPTKAERFFTSLKLLLATAGGVCLYILGSIIRDYADLFGGSSSNASSGLIIVGIFFTVFLVYCLIIAILPALILPWFFKTRKSMQRMVKLVWMSLLVIGSVAGMIIPIFRELRFA